MAIGDELATLDYQSMIGGPLIAVIKAQAQAAVTSVDFIKAVGFDEDSGDPTMVTFSYQKPVETTASDGTTTISVEPYELTVPLLAMVPIPFIRVEETRIDFNAKITSTTESTTASSHELNTSLSAKAAWKVVSAEMKASYAYKRTTSSGHKEERTYSMAVHVRAVQDELPAGTARLLSILENAIKEVPATP